MTTKLNHTPDLNKKPEYTDVQSAARDVVALTREKWGMFNYVSKNSASFPPTITVETPDAVGEWAKTVAKLNDAQLMAAINVPEHPEADVEDGIEEEADYKS